MYKEKKDLKSNRIKLIVETNRNANTKKNNSGSWNFFKKRINEIVRKKGKESRNGDNKIWKQKQMKDDQWEMMRNINEQ